MTRVWYASREAVRDAVDVKEAAHRTSQVDRAIESASDSIDAWLGRHKHGLAPITATRFFRWPSRHYSSPYRLWLDENELVEVSTLTAGGTTIDSDDYFLEPVNSGPPFTFIEIDLDSQAAFDNSGTHQRAIQIVGTWGINNDQKPAGALAEALDASETAVDVSDASLVGVGDVLTVDSERMIVTDRSSLDTGQNLQSDMNALNNDQIVDVSDGTEFAVGEVLLLGSERMKITEITGNNLTVIRAYDGTTLAAHSAPVDIYAFRTLVVERGALGTTASTHDDESAVTRWQVPYLVRDLCIAEAITQLEQEFSAYGARVYSDEAERDSSGTEVVAGRGLSDLRKQCKRRYKLGKFRKRAI